MDQKLITLSLPLFAKLEGEDSHTTENIARRKYYHNTFISMILEELQSTWSIIDITGNHTKTTAGTMYTGQH